VIASVHWTAGKETHCVKRLKNIINWEVTELENVFVLKYLVRLVAMHKA
jgi:hypothetical protein